MKLLLLHLWGDYVLQSGWMAENKTKSWKVAAIHAFVYSLLFLFVVSVRAWFMIFVTHLIIDRFDLARYVIWTKNYYLSNDWKKYDWRCNWAYCSKTGFPLKETPEYLATWLKIIVDNTLHLTINFLAIKYL